MCLTSGQERERERAGSTQLETVQWISNCEAEIYSWIQHCPRIRGEGICVARIILTCLRRFYIPDEILVALDTLDDFQQFFSNDAIYLSIYLSMNLYGYCRDVWLKNACSVIERYNNYHLLFFILIIIRMEKLWTNMFEFLFNLLISSCQFLIYPN